VNSTDEDVLEEDHPPHIAVVGNAYNSTKIYIVMEREIVVRYASFPIAMQQIFLLFYVLNLEYPTIKKRSCDYFLFVQKVLFELDAGRINPKLTSFLNDVARHD